MPPHDLPEDMTFEINVTELMEQHRDPCYQAGLRAYDRRAAEGGTEAECNAARRAAERDCNMMRELAERRLKAAARQEALEKMLAEAEESNRLWEQLFADTETAMIVSESIKKGLEDAGIKLGSDETFACLITVAKRPEYVSAILPPPLPPGETGSRLVQLLEPSLMEAVMDAVEKDRLPKS